MFIFWSLLVLPLFVTLETALLSGLEHRSNQWKYLHALPVSRWSIYASKFLLGASIIGLGILALVGFTIVAGLLFRFLKPGLGFEAPVPWAMMAKYAATVYISSWLMIAIQSWVGLRWFSFVVATSFGIVMTISGMIFVNTGWGRLYPWAIPGLIANGFNTGMPVLPLETAVGCVGGLFVAMIATWHLSRREIL